MIAFFQLPNELNCDNAIPMMCHHERVLVGLGSEYQKIKKRREKIRSQCRQFNLLLLFKPNGMLVVFRLLPMSRRNS